jgi:isoaspartyl peptidase/L-asparaginase-like protein (Ntn-hydrolase superfamily)
MTPIENLLAKLPGARKAGNGWSARCPAHEDGRASLSIAQGDDGKLLLHCHAGCKFDSICTSLGLRASDMMSNGKSSPKQNPTTAKNARKKKTSRITQTYDYRGENGELIFQVVRMDPKDFLQRKPKPGGGWDWSVKGVRVVPYRLPDLLAKPSRIVVIAEGEKDCDNLTRIDLLATTNAGGAGKWTSQHSEFLRKRKVIILPDNDETGRKHAQQVLESLRGIADSVRIVELPDLPLKGDVSDWIAAGGTKDKLKALIEAQPDSAPVTTQPWPEVIPFDETELPAFPTHVLPEPTRSWIEAESHATQTPPDLAAMLALAVCSACIARKVAVEPRPGWREPVNLFVAILLEPGNRKSAVFSDATKPFRELEADLISTARANVARQLSERRQKEARLRKLEKHAGEEADAGSSEEAGRLAAELAETAEPTLPRLIVDDATSEKLGMILADQGGRAASMSPEGGVFDLMAGLYSKSGMPQFGVFLMGHSGDDLITDRVSRKSIRVERPALTCAYAMQPAVIEGIAENAAFRGRGLLARFLYAAPQSWIGNRKIAPPPVSDNIRQAYHDIVRKLGQTNSDTVLRLSTDAEALLREWETNIESMLGDGGQMEIIRDWGAKLAGATLRIAGVLHCIANGTAGVIESRTISASVEIARYLISHAEHMLDKMSASENTTDADAGYVLRWIKRHGKTVFTKSEAQHHGKRRFPKAEDIDSALAELSRRGFVRLRPTVSNGPGRPPSPVYEVNPAALVPKESKTRSQNSQNSSVSFGAPDFGINRSAAKDIDDPIRLFSDPKSDGPYRERI